MQITSHFAMCVAGHRKQCRLHRRLVTRAAGDNMRSVIDTPQTITQPRG
jgi:hypothetical protein